MKIRPKPLSFMIFILIFGGIGISSALDLWKTTSSKMPATYTSGAFEGNYNPSDIRGSYTFGEISDLFEIPIEDLGTAFQVEPKENISSFQCKSLESIYADLKNSGPEIGTDSVRTFVALYKGLPFDLGDAYLLDSAAAILKNLGNLSPASLTYLETHVVSLADIENDVAAKAAEVSSTIESGPIEKPKEDAPIINNASTQPKIENTPIPVPEQQEKPAQSEHTESNSEEKLIKGKTTFREVINWGLSKDSIETLLDNKKIPNLAMTIRDFCNAEGIEFSTVKDSLQQMLDN